MLSEESCGFVIRVRVFVCPLSELEQHNTAGSILASVLAVCAAAPGTAVVNEQVDGAACAGLVINNPQPPPTATTHHPSPTSCMHAAASVAHPMWTGDVTTLIDTLSPCRVSPHAQHCPSGSRHTLMSLALLAVASWMRPSQVN